MAVVSLTTDLGTRDYYLGALKGVLLSNVQQSLSLVDINHHIKTHDITMAAYNIRHAFGGFPAGSVHILHVNMGYSEQPRLLAARYKGHYFIAPDNGVLSLAIDLQEAELFVVDLPEMHRTMSVDLKFALATDYLLSGRPLIEIGLVCDTPETKITLQPTIVGDVIRGMVTYIDVFDNVMLNVSKTLYEQIGQGRPVEIFFRRHAPITKVADSYAAVPIGEPVAIFNETGMLELAINMGRMASLYGIRLDDIVQIKFGFDD